MKEKKTLVIPDVHGRAFWKEAKEFDGQVVFLGDYHDPYPWDFLEGEEMFPWNRDYHKESLENMLEIFRFAEENPDRVTLLLGNHELHYLNKEAPHSRYDYVNEDFLLSFFCDHQHLLHLSKRIDDTLFTHAGISSLWYEELLEYCPEMKPEAVEENIRTALDRNMEDIIEPGNERGGDSIYGGPLWMDVSELTNGRNPILPGPYQIFGHTQQEETGTIVRGQGWACIDSRRVFEVDPDNPEETLKVWKGKIQ